MNSLSVFNIQRFSTHDGVGVRTNIFFKGCPLRCKWCCNPESQSVNADLIYDKRHCSNFLDCVKIPGGAITVSEGILKINRNAVTDIDLYRDVCPSKALVVTGELKSVEDILQEIKKDIPFYHNSGGGVTFTGGEPFYQDDILVKLASEIKQSGIHLAVETCLHVPWEKLAKFIGLIDVFLIDIKHIDPDKFHEFTGGNLDLVIDNLKKLVGSGVKIIARVPVIPSFNYSDVEMKAIIDFVLSMNDIHELNFILYHSLGAGKYEMLGKDNKYLNIKPIQAADVEGYLEYAGEKGLTADIGG